MLNKYKLYDTHTHYNSIEFNQSIDKIYQELEQNCIMTNVIGTDIDDSIKAIEIAKKYKNARACVGIHPTTQIEDIDSYLIKLEEIVKANNGYIIGIGECGLDYFYDNSEKEKQRQKILFKKQIELSIKYSKPLVLHIRDAHSDAIKILSEYNLNKVIIHCFTGSLDDALFYQSQGYYVSFSGIITFKKSQEMKNICRQLDLNLILTETDLPWLSPEPVRGKTNSSLNLKYINQVISELHSIDIDIINNKLFDNARKAFNLRDD